VLQKPQRAQGARCGAMSEIKGNLKILEFFFWGKIVNLQDERVCQFRGKVLLIVDTASESGYTLSGRGRTSLLNSELFLSHGCAVKRQF
jgi:hypothetical protein